MARTASIGIKVEPALKAELEGLAEADHRTLSAYVELVLTEHVQQKRAKAGKR